MLAWKKPRTDGIELREEKPFQKPVRTWIAGLKLSFTWERLGQPLTSRLGNLEAFLPRR